jgi:hypothetical protein
MLMPWRIQSAADRRRAAAALSEFKGSVLVPAGLSDGDPETLRRGVVDRLNAEADPDRDIWIATGRAEHPRSMFSLLHAGVDPAQGATVDLLMALPERDGDGSRGFGGYGELSLLALLLERMNVSRLRIPLPLDGTRTGLAAAGWLPAPGNVYVHGQAAR